MYQEMVFRNTPERIDRIGEFEAYIEYKPIDGENILTMEFSEPVVTDTAALEEVTQEFLRILQQYEERAIYFLNRRITNIFEGMLLDCRAHFEDEVDLNEVDLVADDDEGVIRVPGAYGKIKFRDS